ncbi:MAG: O-antigen ligase family protein, partial [Thermodesulfobacteriota bacterium]
VTLSMVDSLIRVRQVIWSVTICMLVASLYIIKEYVIYSKIYGAGFRPFGGLFMDTNYYALSAVMAMPLTFYLAKTTKGALFRYGLYFTIFIHVFALGLSMSRGGIVGVVAMLATTIILSKYKSKAFVVIAILIVLGMLLIPERLMERFRSTTITTEASSGTVASTTRRWNLIKAGVRMVAEHPVKGVGLGNFKGLSTYYEPMLGPPGIAHNTFVETAAELGLPALFFFMLIIYFTYRDLLRMRRRSSKDNESVLLLNVLIVSFTGFLISGNFLSGQNTKLFWLVIFLSIAIRRYEITGHVYEYEGPEIKALGLEHAAVPERTPSF